MIYPDVYAAMKRAEGIKAEIQLSDAEWLISRLRLGIPVIRANPYHDPKNGQFTNAPGVSIDKKAKNDIIKSDLIIPCDSNGESYSKPQYKLPKKEYGKIVREIDDAYYARYADKKIGVIQDRQYKAQYYFEIHGFNEYNIFLKERD